ncbi:MAG: hypothetical protein L0332_34005 [Chloroflexi bacterium]|nr:hypothetical protein [Chloroflexota bacterium]MCI0574608.1 hypothetical protein [Chloroflexota bacterium]MCI0644040.1 hypothetical protein [Chloroflexota bacterium]MCI0731714.1 hypothetical protein [Chloroflexota bacterium]
MMAEGKGPRVYFNPDGYIELVLAGTADATAIRQLADQAIVLVEENGPVGGLIDGRHGNIIRNVETLRVLQSLQIPKLKRLVILLSRDDPAGIRKPSIVMSIFTAVFGFRPIYVDDEAEARALAAN